MALKNKKIVVVGGATGIGFAVAGKALNAGAEVLIASRSQESLQAALCRLGPGASADRVDAGDEQSVRDFFRRVGSFDHLAMIIKAALPHDTFLSSDLNAVRAAFETKFWGQYRLARHAAEWLRPDGSMVFTSGVASRRATPGMSVVSAMNAATEALARVLAVELAPIRVNTVSPGLVDARPLDPAQPERLQRLVQYVPLARLGGAAEIAEAYLYLFGNAYTTGSVMVVDGGVAC